MSIDYEILTSKGDIKTMLSSACWASFPRTLHYLHDSPYHSYKTGDPFRCRLILDERSSYKKNTPTELRNLSDQVFDKLFGKWFHPDWIIYEHNTPFRKARSGIVYTSACPYFPMVASGSVYRMHYDFSSFLYFWRELDKVQRMMGYKLRPWTQYFMVASITNAGNSGVNFRTGKVTLGPNNGHMIIDGKHGSIEAIQHLSGWTHETLSKGDGVREPLDSMFKQWTETNTMSYSGRDAHFTGFTHPTDSKYICNFIRREAVKAGMEVRSKSNPYCTSSTTHIPEFIEKVCIPNQL